MPTVKQEENSNIEIQQAVHLGTSYHSNIMSTENDNMISKFIQAGSRRKQQESIKSSLYINGVNTANTIVENRANKYSQKWIMSKIPIFNLSNNKYNFVML